MKPKFLYDEKGNEKFVLLDVKSFRKMLDELEDLKLAEIFRREQPLIEGEIRQGKFAKWDDVKAELHKRHRVKRNRKTKKNV